MENKQILFILQIFFNGQEEIIFQYFFQGLLRTAMKLAYIAIAGKVSRLKNCNE